jgi:hypothetical protein
MYCNIVNFRQFAVLICHVNTNRSWAVAITATTAKRHWRDVKGNKKYLPPVTKVHPN